MRDDWKQAWKDEVARAERAERKAARYRELLVESADAIHEEWSMQHGRRLRRQIKEADDVE